MYKTTLTAGGIFQELDKNYYLRDKLKGIIYFIYNVLIAIERIFIV